MQKTQLILIEGISGSGKSTLAQFLAHTLIRSGIACRWWYEEEKGHPLYVFHDRASLQDTVNNLSTGHYQKVIDAALEKCKEFTQAIQSSENIVILDGCLFGYLTWSLFPLDIPDAEIQRYLSQVEQIIEPISPSLIYLYQQDIAQALGKICQRRGSETRAWLMTQATQSFYGKRRGLQGFGGMVTYWKDFQILIDDAFARFNGSKLALENSAGDWKTYERTVLDFLDLPIEEDVAAVSPSAQERLVGIYHFEEGSCHVFLEKDQLMVDGIPLIWQRTRLIPRDHNVFAVESLPFIVTFEEDTHGNITGMRATGPELLHGTVERLYVRKDTTEREIIA
ncbi:hypothetical protein KSC_068280 [Ktedonobacter sp. SOSP1-52]|uniref:hypothetical protein n=1 Tax=Ktedonobacter sp. SOSP1-52 TaxID=2778366 RepID=UPI0019151A36|nr:hypothetical protein [Ktedonobacter sp. SOSP1-52]GHO67936.1 hypothetical protein KSC_068280 [Ktedonobacter sp. SOSP1-52]